MGCRTTTKARRNFYPRPPRGGRRDKGPRMIYSFDISIHALREEGDTHRHHLSKFMQKFLSTPSARRATFHLPILLQKSAISIHALREEGDLKCTFADAYAQWISIHALREEGDYVVHAPHVHAVNFYPRPPRGGRPGALVCKISSGAISIHALREEGDTSTRSMTTSTNYFYPRPPRGGRRLLICTADLGGHISIHALREEGDMPGIRSIRRMRNFYPRPPRGGRP